MFSGGTPNYTVSWSGAGAGSTPGIAASPYTITGLVAGAYSITVTDVNGSTGTASATILYLPVKNLTGPTYHTTIQAAIDAAAATDIIEVCAGTYPEQLTVNKALDIRGPNYGTAGNGVRVAEAIIVPPSELNLDVPREWDDTPLVTISADNVKMDGLKISGDNPLISGYSYAGMNIEAGRGIVAIANDVTFRNNIVEKFTFIGFHAEGDLPTPTYNDLILANNKFDNIHDLNQLGYGFAMYVQATAGAVTGNVVTNSRSGIQVQPYQVVNGPNGVSTLSGNTFAVWRNPVYYNYAEVGASAWTISGNTMTAVAPPLNPTGPVLWEGIRVETMAASGNGGTITGNNINGAGAVVDNIKWWGVWGMDYRGTGSTSTQVYFTNNTVTNVETGFAHMADADIVLTGNTLSASNQVISIQRNYSSAGVVQPNGGTFDIDATGGNTINGVATAGATDAQLFVIEDVVNHKIDWKTLGFVTVKAANAYVTDINALQTSINNDYTRIRNAVELVANNWTINLNGTFNWIEANAAASWSLGNDEVVSAADDYSILVPANRTGITFTAPLGLGTATVQGPGDLAGSKP